MSHMQWDFMQAKYTRFGGKLDVEGNPMFCSGVKWLPTLFSLSYWKVNKQTNKISIYIIEEILLILAKNVCVHDLWKNNCGINNEVHVWRKWHSQILERHGVCGGLPQPMI